MSMLSLLKTLSQNEENSYARQPFVYLFSGEGKLTPQERKKSSQVIYKKKAKELPNGWKKPISCPIKYGVKVNERKSEETGLSSRAKEPTLIIRTRLDFRPHFFEASKPQKNNHTFFFSATFFYFHIKSYMDPCQFTWLFFSPFLGTGNRERTEKTTSDRNEQSLLQCLTVRLHAVEENGKRRFLSLLTALLPLLPTGLKTSSKSRHVGRLGF